MANAAAAFVAIFTTANESHGLGSCLVPAEMFPDPSKSGK